MLTDHDLLVRAEEARAGAYAPYSKFPVGAALESADGEVFTGCNIENASYGLTICAERVALFSAVAAGKREFRRLALSMVPEAPSECIVPCGACRQVLAEFAPDLTLVLPEGDGTGPRQESLRTFFPHVFRLP